MKFGVIADPQYADRDKKYEDTDFRSGLPKLQEAIEFFNTQDDLAFVVVLGDLVNGDDINEVTRMRAVLDDSRHKVYLALGNHDYKIAGHDRKKAAEIFGLDNTYYSWSKDGYRFVLMDTNDGDLSDASLTSEDWIETMRKYAERHQGLDGLLTGERGWNGFVEQEQQEWLKSELVKAEEAGERVVLLGHDPLFPNVAERVQNAKEVLELMYPHLDNIVASFAGHFHPGAYAPLERGVPFITFRGMVNDYGTAYSIIELDGRNVKTTGFGVENSYSHYRY